MNGENIVNKDSKEEKTLVLMDDLQAGELFELAKSIINTTNFEGENLQYALRVRTETMLLASVLIYMYNYTAKDVQTIDSARSLITAAVSSDDVIPLDNIMDKIEDYEYGAVCLKFYKAFCAVGRDMRNTVAASLQARLLEVEYSRPGNIMTRYFRKFRDDDQKHICQEEHVESEAEMPISSNVPQ